MKEARQPLPQRNVPLTATVSGGGAKGAKMAHLTALSRKAAMSPNVQHITATQRKADEFTAENATRRAPQPVKSQPLTPVLQKVGDDKEVDLESAAGRYAAPTDWKAKAAEKLRRGIREARERKQKTLQDAISVRAILRDLDGFVASGLKQLEADIAAQLDLSAAETAKSRHLTRALSVREKQCGLAVSQSIYTGLLSASAFEAEAASGSLANDYGAVASAMHHGEFTHRIQWYILMHAMSNGFTVNVANDAPDGFNFPPKQLLINILTSGVEFENQEMAPAGMSPGRNNLWDVLFDRSSGKAGYNPKNTEIGVTDPERLTMMLDNREGASAGPGTEPIMGKLGDNAPELSGIVTRRTELRKRQKVNKDGQIYLDKDAYEERKLAEIDPETNAPKYTRKPNPESDRSSRVLVRNRPQSLVGSRAGNNTHVPYAPDVPL